MATKARGRIPRAFSLCDASVAAELEQGRPLVCRPLSRTLPAPAAQEAQTLGDCWGTYALTAEFRRIGTIDDR